MKNIRMVLLLLLISFSSYGQNLAEEEVFVHVSKNIGVVNEQVWFYLQVNGHKQRSPSKIAYVEMVNRQNIPVFQSIIALEQGKAEGMIKIPASLDSDHYLLRFYTRISPILNRNGKGVFNSFITVINPKKGPIPIGLPQNSGNYAFQDAEAFHIQESQVSIKSALDISPDFIQGPINISVSIKNPFLDQRFQGTVGQEIYQPLVQPKVIPEIFGHIVHGKNLDAQVDTTETFFLSAHGRQSVLHSAKPDADGNLYFELGPLKSYNFLIAQSLQYEKQLNFEPQSPFLDLIFKEDFDFPSLELTEEDGPFLEKLILAAQLAPHFFHTETFTTLPIITGFIADRTYFLDDYTRFESLETTLREYIPEVLVRRQSRTTLFKLINTPLGSLFQENPLILIDAMPVFDTEALANFDPKGIEKLEILNREFSLNEDKFSGVLSFISFENDFGEFQLPQNSLYLNYWDLMPKWKLQTPHFNPYLEEANYPDFRSSLYWATAQDKNALSILTSNLIGRFEVRLSFPDKDGNMQSYKTQFQTVD